MANKVKDSELHRIVLSCIIYNSERKYLLTKRAATVKAFPNKWHPPGGGMEMSDYIDTPADTEGQWYHALEGTLRREVQEEVGLEIGKPEYLLDLVFIRPDGIPVLVLTYYASYVSGDVDISKEEDTVDYVWVTAEEAKGYNLIKGVADEIDMVETILGEKKE